MKLCFLVESFALSGGNYVIAQHAQHLIAHGHEVTVATLRRDEPSRLKWHGALAAMRIVTIAEAAAASYDLAFATWWSTVYELPRLKAGQYAYFVQDIESLFYMNRADPAKALAEGTYAFSLPGVTVSNWARDRLKEHFGLDLALAHNGIDKELYAVQGTAAAPRRAGRLRVLIEGALGNPRKNTARAIELARRSKADEIWLLTSSRISSYPGVDRLFSHVPVSECPAIYRSCDVLLKLSSVESFGLPYLEMLHCGGTVVSFDIPGPSDFLRHNKNALIAPLGDEAAVVAHIAALKNDAALLARLSQGGLETARTWPGWPEASRRFEEAAMHILSAPRVSPATLQAMTKGSAAASAQSQANRDRGAKALARALLAQAKARSPALEALVATQRARHVEAKRLYIPDAIDREKYYRPSILALSA